MCWRCSCGCRGAACVGALAAVDAYREVSCISGLKGTAAISGTSVRSMLRPGVAQAQCEPEAGTAVCTAQRQHGWQQHESGKGFICMQATTAA